jgi:hypothetical protein
MQAVVSAASLLAALNILGTTPMLTPFQFGAKGDNATDDTVALNAAIAAAVAGGVRLYVPGTPKGYLISGQLLVAGPVELAGDFGATLLTTTSLTADVFHVTGSNVFIHDFQVSSAGITKTAGYHVNLCGSSQASIKLKRLTLTSPLYGVNVSSSFASILDMDEVYIYNTLGTNGIGMVIAAGDELRIRHCLMNSGASPQPNAGLLIENSGDITLEDVNIIQHGRDLLINPGTGQEVDSVWATDCYFDTSSAQGMLIQPSGTGTVQRCRFIGCWFSSHTLDGVEITGSSGTVNGIEFIDCHAFNNGQTGFNLVYGSNYTFTACQAAGNPNGAGLAIAAGISHITAGLNTFGPTGGFGANNYGVFVAAGASDHLIIVNNQLQGNTTAAFNNGSSGSHTIVSPNLTS